jgi:(1->4)-alpha-D-glucan 1-alpha-D-glucosylmutase
VSDWVLPNEAYEAACVKYLHGILLVDPYNVFLSKLVDWVDKLTPAGIVKSLGQTVLRMTSPGVPDLYQGTDFWDFSLVDPDNRRPVDYEARERELDGYAAIKGMDGWQQGTLKQQIICNTLALLARQPELFLNGEYLPLAIEGPLADRAIAFARRCQQRMVIVVVTCLPYPLLEQGDAPVMRPQAWKDTAIILAEQYDVSWIDVLTNEKTNVADGRIRLSDALRLLPLAILANG